MPESDYIQKNPGYLVDVTKAGAEKMLNTSADIMIKNYNSLRKKMMKEKNLGNLSVDSVKEIGISMATFSEHYVRMLDLLRILDDLKGGPCLRNIYGEKI